MSDELYPAAASAKYEALTPEQGFVCKAIERWSGRSWVTLAEVTFEGGDHVSNRYKGSEVDALYELLRIERIMSGYAVVVESLPPVPFYEEDFSTSSVIATVRNEVPFNQSERRQAATVGLQWDLLTADWFRPLTGEEAQLVERWYSWIRDPQPDGGLPLSGSAERIKEACSKLTRSLDVLLPEKFRPYW